MEAKRDAQNPVACSSSFIYGIPCIPAVVVGFIDLTTLILGVTSEHLSKYRKVSNELNSYGHGFK